MTDLVIGLLIAGGFIQVITIGLVVFLVCVRTENREERHDH